MNARKFAKPIFFVLSFIVAGIVMARLWPREVVEHRFATYHQAMIAGAIENGSLPQWIPKTATDIHSYSNLDLNSEVITFEFGTDFEQFVSKQQSAPAKSASAMGILIQDEAFSDPRALIYIPKILPDGESYQGALLINRSRRKALYFQ